jgi:signal peptidase I
MKKKKITDGPMGYIIYAVLGIFIAFLVNQTLGFALTTDLPVVAVVTSSMQHDESTEMNHYQWLEKTLDYEREYISSWPISGGFLIGDMPIVQGSPEYNVGDVVVYSVPGQNVPVIHRIIKINPDGTYQTKGDHNPQQLPFEFSIKKEWVHGKVVVVVPKIGYFKVIVSRILGGTA